MGMIHTLACKIARRTMHFYGMRRAPDFIVGSKEAPYLLRWYVFGARPHATEPRMESRTFLGLLRIYVHAFRRSDDDRALHDHPAASLSIGLWGSAVEHTIRTGGVHHRRQLSGGDIRFRRARFAHRIEIEPGQNYYTLFIFFRNTRDWGFHCTRDWVPWRKFVASDNPGAVGAGCGED